ncbi:hypothetical protein ACLMJK_006688 [Lecanora helva]
MAHHLQSNHDRVLAVQGLSNSSFRGHAGTPVTGDDEITSDVDEPPDKSMHFTKLKSSGDREFNAPYSHNHTPSPRISFERKESLLTQALLSSPELHPISDSEAPMLTSDGGLTSPTRTTTPSPPWPAALSGVRLETSKEHQNQGSNNASDALQSPSHETNVEAGLGRKRCITFACGRQPASDKSSDLPAKTQATTEIPAKVASPPKRPCMLKFVCPMKSSRAQPIKKVIREKSPCPSKLKASASQVEPVNTVLDPTVPPRQNSETAVNPELPNSLPLPSCLQSQQGKKFNRIDFQKSEATRFHEFACHYTADEEWTNEQTAYRKKITINDTLRKENAIRKLGEEAEEEALDEEAEEDLANDHDDENHEENDSNDDFQNNVSDDGNETDDEQGFADSDDESSNGSDYHFWTPGLTTAATSTDHLDHCRPSACEEISSSSVDSTDDIRKRRRPSSSKEMRSKSSLFRPTTLDLPDSSDFVVGTVDEDRHIEEAYVSCLEERRRSKHNTIPQDIDPSFPTSEPEAENDEEDEEEQEQDDDNDDDDDDNDDEKGSEERKLTSMDKMSDRDMENRSDSEDECLGMGGKSTRPMTLSPKRLLSPPPKVGTSHRSPPPRRLFGHSTHRLRSPPPMQRKLHSPPSSRQPSANRSPARYGVGIDMPHLAQRPNLTHTTSLPRTPNPFWGQHRESRFHGLDSPTSGTSPKDTSLKRTETHSRGPIDIVQGLETKRQRRKDKFWRQQCRAAGKEKQRRCQPGKGAERMKELGLEMADRFRGYGQRAQLVLSM